MSEAEKDKATGRSVSLPISVWQRIDELGMGRAAYFRTLVMEDLRRRESHQVPNEIRQLLERCAELKVDPRGALHTAIIEEQCSSIKSYGNKTTAAA